MSEAKHAERAAAARRFKPYPSYKDSGVEWLVDVPAHWRVLALKRIGDLRAGAGFPDDEQGLMTEEIPFFKVGDMGVPGNEREMRECQHTVSKATARRLRAFVFPAGTIVFAKVGAALMLNRRRLLTRPSCIDNNVMGFMPRDCDRTWAMYWLSGLDMGELANPGAVPSVNEGQMRDTPAVVPPEPEQRAIAAFLDRETARIDALVEKKERLIELLQEQRTALISDCVTGKAEVRRMKDENGNSSFIFHPSSFPMKDSGVEWLGEIPAHWGVKRIRDIAEALQTGPFGSQLHANEYVLGGYPVINPANLRDGSLVPDEECTVDDTGAERLAHHRLHAGDILFARRGELGRCGLVTSQEEGWLCGTGCLRLRVRRDAVRPSFLIRLLSTSGVADWLGLQSVGATMQNLNTSIIGRIPLVVPPTEEQEAIATFLNRETARIDALVAKVGDAIDRLKELRTALISAAVTGKIDVREG